MVSATENVAGSGAAAAAASTQTEDVPADVFAGELETKLAEAEAAMDKIARALEKMATAFPGATISARSGGVGDAAQYLMQSGASTTVNISQEMMAQIAESDDMFDRLKQMLQQVLSAGDQQRLVNAGGEVQRTITVDDMQVRYVEVQRGPNGTQLSLSALSLETRQLIDNTLDELLGLRSNNASFNRRRWSFADLINGSSSWRMQSFVSGQSLDRVMGSLSGGASGAGVGQGMVSSQFMTARIEMTVQQWAESGTGSGTDFMAYMEMMGLCDPLVLDLGGEGINLTSAEDGVYFDIKGDGSPVQTAFIKGNNAFLYLDENGNGVADDVNELFGDTGGFANGFDKLAQHDDNGDGVIDENDAIYDRLRVWRDLNGDGVNQADESMSLADAGVKSINLGYENRYELDEHGNVIGERSSFTRADGSTGMVADVWLKNRQKR